MKLSLFLSSIFISSTLLAAPAPSASVVSLKQKALNESKMDGLAKASATDAQVPGMLTLKDPRPEVVTRPWSYFAALSGQMFKPQGVAQKSGSDSFDLNKSSSTFMPGLEIGVISLPLQTKSIIWKLGLRAKAGMTSQATDLTLSSGFRIEDARLNSTLFSAGGLFSVQWEGLNWLALTFSPQYGSLTYTQTSANEFATFSKQAGFESMGYGLDFALNRKWSLFTEWTQKSIQDKGEIALQKDNFELGTRFTW